MEVILFVRKLQACAACAFFLICSFVIYSGEWWNKTFLEKTRCCCCRLCSRTCLHKLSGTLSEGWSHGTHLEDATSEAVNKALCILLAGREHASEKHISVFKRCIHMCCTCMKEVLVSLLCSFQHGTCWEEPKSSVCNWRNKRWQGFKKI